MDAGSPPGAAAPRQPWALPPEVVDLVLRGLAWRRTPLSRLIPGFPRGGTMAALRITCKAACVAVDARLTGLCLDWEDQDSRAAADAAAAGAPPRFAAVDALSIERSATMYGFCSSEPGELAALLQALPGAVPALQELRLCGLAACPAGSAPPPGFVSTAFCLRMADVFAAAVRLPALR